MYEYKRMENYHKPINGIFEGLSLPFRGGRLVVLRIGGSLALMLNAVEKNQNN